VNYNNKAETHRFSIEVNNTNDAPSAISLSPQTIDENLPTGAAIGSLSATDEDANDSHTFQLTDENGTLTTDNQYFEIVGNTLKTKSMFDFETKSQYSIYVKATDSKGASTAKWLTVNVNNLIETFVNQATLPVFKIYPNPASQWVMVEIDNSLIVNSIELIDICGRVIHSQNMVNGFSRIPLQKCISGLYFIRIIQGENVFTQKLIVKP